VSVTGSNLAQRTARMLARTWNRTGKAPGWYYQAVERWGKHLASRPLTAELVNGCQVYCDLGDEVQRQIYFLGLYEPVESYLFTQLVKPGMCVVDAGANVGQYTLLASTAVGPRGHVHSFEPVPATFANLEHNVLANQLANVSLFRAALWQVRTEVSLGISQKDAGNNAGAYTITLPDSGAVVKASAISLDEHAAEHRIQRIDVIKMDIEGAELFALRGMTELLRQHKPTILLEINRPLALRAGYLPEQTWEFLSQFGYRGWMVGPSALECHDVRSLADVERANVIFHINDLAPEIAMGWDLKSVLRWTRTGNMNFMSRMPCK
jgi:FkbM family methyltransferase